MSPKKVSHNAARKKAQNLGAPLLTPPIHDPTVGYEDYVSVKEKSTSNSTDDSSGVDDWTLDTTN